MDGCNFVIFKRSFKHQLFWETGVKHYLRAIKVQQSRAIFTTSPLLLLLLQSRGGNDGCGFDYTSCIILFYNNYFERKDCTEHYTVSHGAMPRF